MSRVTRTTPAAPPQPEAKLPAVRADQEKPFVVVRKGGGREEFKQFTAATQCSRRTAPGCSSSPATARS